MNVACSPGKAGRPDLGVPELSGTDTNKEKTSKQACLDYRLKFSKKSPKKRCPTPNMVRGFPPNITRCGAFLSFLL